MIVFLRIFSKIVGPFIFISFITGICNVEQKDFILWDFIVERFLW